MSYYLLPFTDLTTTYIPNSVIGESLNPWTITLNTLSDSVPFKT